MAWKFRQEYVKDGDVVEPSEWRLNVNEMYSELNGFLDSDNIQREVIGNSKIKRGSFTEVLTNWNIVRSYVFSHEESGWQTEAKTIYNRDRNNKNSRPFPAGKHTYGDKTTDEYLELLNNKKRLPYVEFNADQDGLLICEFSGFVTWLPQSTNSQDLARSNHPGEIDYLFKDGMSLRTYGYFAKQSAHFKSLSSYVLCSQWRITVNGQSVAETGFLGCEYSSHPIYLVGTTPITKGKETSVQLEAQFVWYSHGKDHTIQASGWNPLPSTKYGGGKHHPMDGYRSNYDKFSYRVDCSLNSPVMLVTYRKR